MAQFQVGQRVFTVNREGYLKRLGRLSLDQIASDLECLAELEKTREVGLLICSDNDWVEIVKVAQDIAFEVECRRLYRDCGITLEVR